jgi:hypothetical protein
VAKQAVFTVAMGKPEFARQGLALGRSLKLIGDQTHRIIYTDMPDHPWESCFHEVIQAKDEWKSTLPLDALDLCDATEILVLDVDMIAFKRLGPIFDYCRAKGFCVQGSFAKTGTWWDQQIEDLCRTVGLEQIPRFNGGLIYYERRPDVVDLIADIKGKNESLKVEKGFLNRHGHVSTELSIMLAGASHPAFHLISDHHNFQASGSGPCVMPKIDVETNTCRFISRQQRIKVVEPFLWHTYFYRHDLLYARQIRKLEKLSQIEACTERGFVPITLRTRRSIDKRILKMRGKL